MTINLLINTGLVRKTGKEGNRILYCLPQGTES